MTADENFGIGLALAKTIIEEDGGYLQVKSFVGKGTTFVLRFGNGISADIHS